MYTNKIAIDFLRRNEEEEEEETDELIKSNVNVS